VLNCSRNDLFIATSSYYLIDTYVPLKGIDIFLNLSFHF
jgi:hypothetical protein